jgi:hypothetical protein
MFYGQVGYGKAYSEATGFDDQIQFGSPWATASDPDTQNLTSARYNCGSNCGYTLPNLQSGDSVRAVWTASSGGKTQTLFKYDVQGAR